MFLFRTFRCDDLLSQPARKIMAAAASAADDKLTLHVLFLDIPANQLMFEFK